MNRLVTVLLFIPLVVLFGCETPATREDSMLEYVDATTYHQELIFKCYGEVGAEYWDPGDPWTCPQYTKEDLRPIIEDYFEAEQLTYLGIPGNQDYGLIYEPLDGFIREYKQEFPSSTSEHIIRSMEYLTVFALTSEGEDVLVYFPAYKPKGEPDQFYIYEYETNLTYSLLEEIVTAYQDYCITYPVTVDITTTETEETITTDEQICITDSILDMVQIDDQRDANMEGHYFFATMDTYLWRNEEWVVKQTWYSMISRNPLFISLINGTITLSTSTYDPNTETIDEIIILELDQEDLSSLRQEDTTE